MPSCCLWQIAFLLFHVGGLQFLTSSAVAAELEKDSPAIALTPIVTAGLANPVFLTYAGDVPERLYLIEQPGRIRLLEGHTLLPTPFLDITDRVLSGGERGLLGLAFHPQYETNGRFFVNYTRKPDGATAIAEYRRGTTFTAPDRERMLLIVPQPYANHNGGMLAFGTDGNLYIGLGDGGSGGDPENHAQNPEDLLGKILRIDTDQGDPYGIPPDNPFAKQGGRPEIYALGFRNPWRFSFDYQTEHLWVADVGQSAWEEIDLVTSGGNYGWRSLEGTHCFHPPTGCQQPTFTQPIFEYAHERGRCSIIGGYVYRGHTLANLHGSYVYGDFCSGEIFALSASSLGQTPKEPRVILKSGLRISSFGVDGTGELYVVDHKGGLYRLSPRETKESGIPSNRINTSVDQTKD